MTRKASFAIVALAALSLGLPGLAAAVTINFSTAGVFLNPTAEPTPPVSPMSGVGTDTFKWGDAVSGSSQSQLHFSGSSFNHDVAPGTSEWFLLGDLDFHNGRIGVNTGASAVDLSITLTFTSPVVGPQALTVSLDINNTLNPAADTVSLSAPLASISFPSDGLMYTLEVSKFWHPDVDGWCCNGSGTETSLTVDEDCDISAKLKGRISVVEQPIPEPTTLFLLGSGLLGLFVRRRRG